MTLGNLGLPISARWTATRNTRHKNLPARPAANPEAGPDWKPRRPGRRTRWRPPRPGKGKPADLPARGAFCRSKSMRSKPLGCRAGTPRQPTPSASKARPQMERGENSQPSKNRRQPRREAARDPGTPRTSARSPIPSRFRASSPVRPERSMFEPTGKWIASRPVAKRIAGSHRPQEA